jgi:hypothetical protein
MANSDSGLTVEEMIAQLSNYFQEERKRRESLISPSPSPTPPTPAPTPPKQTEFKPEPHQTGYLSADDVAYLERFVRENNRFEQVKPRW